MQHTIDFELAPLMAAIERLDCERDERKLLRLLARYGARTEKPVVTIDDAQGDVEWTMRATVSDLVELGGVSESTVHRRLRYAREQACYVAVQHVWIDDEDRGKAYEVNEFFVHWRDPIFADESLRVWPLDALAEPLLTPLRRGVKTGIGTPSKGCQNAVLRPPPTSSPINLRSSSPTLSAPSPGRSPNDARWGEVEEAVVSELNDWEPPLAAARARLTADAALAIVEVYRQFKQHLEPGHLWYRLVNAHPSWEPVDHWSIDLRKLHARRRDAASRPRPELVDVDLEGRQERFELVEKTFGPILDAMPRPDVEALVDRASDHARGLYRQGHVDDARHLLLLQLETESRHAGPHGDR